MSFQQFVHDRATDLAHAYGVYGKSTALQDIKHYLSQIASIIDRDAGTNPSSYITPVSVPDYELKALRNSIHLIDSRAIAQARPTCEKIGVDATAAALCLKYMSANNEMELPDRNSLSLEQMTQLLGLLRSIEIKHGFTQV